MLQLRDIAPNSKISVWVGDHLMSINPFQQAGMLQRQFLRSLLGRWALINRGWPVCAKVTAELSSFVGCSLKRRMGCRFQMKFWVQEFGVIRIIRVLARYLELDLATAGDLHTPESDLETVYILGQLFLGKLGPRRHIGQHESGALHHSIVP